MINLEIAKRLYNAIETAKLDTDDIFVATLINEFKNYCAACGEDFKVIYSQLQNENSK